MSLRKDGTALYVRSSGLLSILSFGSEIVLFCYSCFMFVSLVILQEWKKISCFRHEEFSSESQQSEYVEHFVPEKMESECNNSNKVKRDLKLTLREVIITSAWLYDGFELLVLRRSAVIRYMFS